MRGREKSPRVPCAGFVTCKRTLRPGPPDDPRWTHDRRRRRPRRLAPQRGRRRLRFRHRRRRGGAAWGCSRVSASCRSRLVGAGLCAGGPA
jgi:hypothetical protein